jgi:disulfide bond formation protein DsbB
MSASQQDRLASASSTSVSVGQATRPSWGSEVLAVGIAAVAIVVALTAAVGAGFLMRALQVRLTPNPSAPLPILAMPALPTLAKDSYVHGRDLYIATCATCHGPAGTGVPGLGKDLTRSLFVSELSDAGLAAFIAKGRDPTDPLNTTRVAMPPNGGNPDLHDADRAALVAFVRGIQDSRRVPEGVPTLVASPQSIKPPSDADKAKALIAAGGDVELAEYIAHGAVIYKASCAACHGADARGMPTLGKDLIASDFVQKLDDDALLAFLLKGRDPSDPANTTKVAMPPKGGNPALSEDDLLDVIAYLRSLRGPVAPKRS